jgi:hypothetical protein
MENDAVVIKTVTAAARAAQAWADLQVLLDSEVDPDDPQQVGELITTLIVRRAQDPQLAEALARWVQEASQGMVVNVISEGATFNGPAIQLP